MKRFYVIFLFFFFWVYLPAQQWQNVEAGKVIVQLKPDVADNFEKRVIRASSDTDTAILNTGIKSFDGINKRYRATNMRRIFPYGGEYEAKHRKYGLHLWYEIIIPEDENPEKVAAEYKKDDNILISEPRYKIRRHSMASSPMNVGIPNDPNFFRQWNFNNTGQTGGVPGADIRLLDAWERVKTLGIKNNNVIVAVKDGGVYYDHEDLQANMWTNEKGEHGYNFWRDSNTIVPDEHGTHVAGVIAAETGNGKGVAGIAGNTDLGYGAKIMSVQILDGSNSVLQIGQAFVYAADNGAVISQNSWGYERANVYDPSDLAAINYFIREAGRDKDGNPRPGTPMVGGLVIFAAGNDGKDDRWYPAYFDNVMAVAATNHYGKLAWYSNFGSWIDISAPGGDTREAGKNRTGGIYSTSYSARIRNNYDYMQGTSMACPHVSGVAALILSVYGNENYTPDMLRARLLCSATPLTDFDPTNASRMGAGLVNASAAIAPINNTLNKITDLTSETINAVSCRLNWTVAQSEAVSYTVACAAENITEENFDLYATKPVALMQEKGTTAQITFSGLSPNSTHYIAIRYNDIQCQSSPISNVVTVTTRGNEAPIIINPIPDITLRDVAEETVFNIGNVFFDVDGDKMRYEVIVDFPRIVTAKILGDLLFIKPALAGRTEIKLTADDGNSGRTELSIPVTIEQNRAPEFKGLISTVTLIPFSDPLVINLADYASDPEDDPIFFSLQNIKNNIANVSIKETILTIDPKRHGYIALQVVATDTYSAKTTETIHLTVEQKYAPDDTDYLLVYPNPTADILWYSFIVNEKSASIYIQLIDSSGKITIQTPNQELSEGTYYKNIDISNLNAGIYFLQYIKEGKVIDTKKVVKQ